MYTDGNFPAPLQVLVFLGSAMLAGVLTLASTYGFLRHKTWASKTLGTLMGGLGLYLLLLLVFSIFSRERTLARGEEKYFCEIDCHLAYSIADLRWSDAGAPPSVAVTLRTRFDENTISAHRPKDAPLTPDPRKVVLVDGTGRVYSPTATEGTPLDRELVPGQWYTTTLVFPVGTQTSGLRLLITSASAPLPLLIGNEMSLGHRKTYLAL
jgi:hypothetical protein